MAGISLPVSPNDVKYLDSQLLDSNTGRIKLLPASVYKGIDPIHLMAWGTWQARYSFPTIELIEWVKAKIGDRKAIEVGAGNGDLGYYLGIPQTDSYCQLIPWVQLYYRMNGQVPTNPLPDVQKLDAIEAIDKYKPQVVVGSFITQKAYDDSPNDGKSGNCYGPEEENILSRADCYIHIGNDSPHGNKRIKKHPHEVLRFDWLVTKCMDPAKNAIYVWGK
jgi:hypothetical protein